MLYHTMRVVMVRIEYVCMRSYIHAELLEGGRENRSESWMYKC